MSRVREKVRSGVSGKQRREKGLNSGWRGFIKKAPTSYDGHEWCPRPD